MFHVPHQVCWLSYRHKRIEIMFLVAFAIICLLRCASYFWLSHKSLSKIGVNLAAEELHLDHYSTSGKNPQYNLNIKVKKKPYSAHFEKCVAGTLHFS
jgi:hypothetical protein